MYHQFTSNQNKGMVWKIMGDNDMFNGILPTKSGEVKAEFDKKIAQIGTQINAGDQLLQLNKRVISEMLPVITNYKNTENIIYNADAISKQRQTVFQTELKNKQADFEKFNSKPAPATIDFSDKMDTPLGAEMDKILAEQIAMREKDLNQVLEVQDKAAASKWLQNDKIKIGEIIEDISPKRVNFLLPEEGNSASASASSPASSPASAIPIDNFMALLKKKPTEDTLTRIKELLIDISAKQTQILNML